MINAKDVKIITELRKNARESLTEISKKTHIPISTIYTRLMGYKGDIIKKHTTLLDFTALGYHTVAMIFVSCNQEEKEALTNALIKAESVNSVFKLNNEYQLMFEGVFRTVLEVDEFLEKIEDRFTITKRKIFYVAKELRREAFVA